MAKIKPQDVVNLLRANPRLGSAELCLRLGGINRSTLMRAIRTLGDSVISCGDTRRTRYAIRRQHYGNINPIPIYQIDESGNGNEIGHLSLTYPQGSSIDYLQHFPWPLSADMQDGWFEGLPYPVFDMRPQGFLGRNFAKSHALDLGIPDSPEQWTDDHIVQALSIKGHDQPGNLILGQVAYRRFLQNQAQAGNRFLAESQLPAEYPMLAEKALSQGEAGSSAGGEFPKFTSSRLLNGNKVDVIVKFSGADDSIAVRRWSDLLICEQIASVIMRQAFGIETVESTIYQFAGRTFLEVVRFDRHGDYGRSGICTLASINVDLLGSTGSWPQKLIALKNISPKDARWISEADIETVTRLWWFGKLIGNTDMHDGNLAFRPGLKLAPIYDMLPMLYAPNRGGEVPEKTFSPELPLPNEKSSWVVSARAAIKFWEACSVDLGISAGFRNICANNQRNIAQSLSLIQ